MSEGQVIEDTEVPAAASEQAAEEAGFAEGFASVAAGEPLEPVAEQPEAGPSEEDLKVIAEIAKDEEPTYTKEQIDALMAKAAQIDALNGRFDKLAGHMGTMLERIEALRQPAPKAPLATEPEPAKLSDGQAFDPKAFEENYEEFAAYVRSQVARGITVPAEITEKLNAADQRIAAAEAKSLEAAQKVEERMISFMHSDWKQTVTSEPYRVWLSTQSPDVQNLANSPFADELGGVLTAFKSAQSQAAKAAKNQNRLEEALVPNGVPGARASEPTEEDAFRAGFKSVVGQ